MYNFHITMGYKNIYHPFLKPIDSFNLISFYTQYNLCRFEIK